MKNLFLALVLVIGFGVALLIERAPQGGEFVSEINTTLSQLSRDFPVVSTPARANRVRHRDGLLAGDCLLSNAVAHSSKVSNQPTQGEINIAEPDCGGWND